MGYVSEPSELYSPRAAAVLFTRALRQVELIEPASLREPVAAMLAAGIERCALVPSLVGQQVNYLIALAQALADTSLKPCTPVSCADGLMELEPGQGDAR